MTMSKRTFVFILTILAAMQAWAYTIRGSIISDNSPVAEVLVKLSDSEGKEIGQSTTDSKGVFVFSDIESEKIVVLAEADGYSPLRLEIVTGKLLNKRDRSIRASSNSDNGVSWDY